MLQIFLKTLLFYSVTGYILNYLFPGKVKNKFKYASYYLTLLHQGLILPYYFVIRNLDIDDLGTTQIMCISTINYFFVDSVINRSQIFKDYKFLLHHLITISVVLFGVILCDLRSYYIIGILFCLEFGSLWLSVTDLYPTKLNYKLRFYFYLLSRVINLKFLKDAVIDNYNNLPFTLFFLFTLGMVLLYCHNILIGYYLYKGSFKNRINESNHHNS
tara:strand:- start:686 stop:1333 length:648 start_codon:yes stop_codon:yes gene_type:complete